MDNILVCDIDNTIADTAAELVRRFGDPDDPYDYDAYLPKAFATSQWPNIFRCAKPVSGSLEAHRALAAADWRIQFVTARLPFMVDATMQWLVANGYMGRHVDGLTCGPHKADVLEECYQTGARVVYVDDIPIAAVPAGVLVIPHARPWQPDGLAWDAILTQLMVVS